MFSFLSIILNFAGRTLSKIIIIMVILNATYGFEKNNELVIQNQDITALSKSYFNTFPSPESITTVHMENNKILWVDYDAFCKFTNLTHLHLSGNKLKSFLIYAPNLKYLNLSYNEIDEVDLSIFEECPELETLILAGNRLTKLQWNLSLVPIQEIDLSNNSLGFVNISSPSLRALSLRYNQHFELSLKLNTPQLEDLNIQFALTSQNITDYCNKGLFIHYLHNGKKFIYSCREGGNTENTNLAGVGKFAKLKTTFNNVIGKFAKLKDIFKSIGEDEASAPSVTGNEEMSRERVGCEFSTLKADIDDVIVTSQEMYLLTINFLVLLTIIGALMISQIVMLVLFLKNKEENHYC